MNYWDLIKDAFWITLRNRYVWFFGFASHGDDDFSFGASFSKIPESFRNLT